MKKFFVGFAVLFFVFLIAVFLIFNQRAREAVESAESQLLQKGAGEVKIEYTKVVFDWNDIFVCGKTRVKNNVDIDMITAKTIYFEHFAGEVASLRPASSTGEDTTICRMDSPWWWIRW